MVAVEVQIWNTGEVEALSFHEPKHDRCSNAVHALVIRQLHRMYIDNYELQSTANRVWLHQKILFLTVCRDFT